LFEKQFRIEAPETGFQMKVKAWVGSWVNMNMHPRNGWKRVALVSRVLSVVCFGMFRMGFVGSVVHQQQEQYQRIQHQHDLEVGLATVKGVLDACFIVALGFAVWSLEGEERKGPIRTSKEGGGVRGFGGGGSGSGSGGRVHGISGRREIRNGRKEGEGRSTWLSFIIGHVRVIILYSFFFGLVTDIRLIINSSCKIICMLFVFV
jgi:hypothetical protein